MFFREAYLLYDEDHTNALDQIFITTIIAHELAHKWFGNLVTCFWWSNLWLNESFASFLEYFAADWVIFFSFGTTFFVLIIIMIIYILVYKSSTLKFHVKF